MAGLVAKDVHQNNTCDDEIALCIQQKGHHSRFIQSMQIFKRGKKNLL